MRTIERAQLDRLFGSEPTPVYEYAATLLRVVDGDTLDVLLDLGFKVRTEQRLRVFAINTPEKRGVERAAGLLATDYARSLLPVGTALKVRTYSATAEEFNRYTAEVWWLKQDGSYASYNRRMVEAGYAAVWTADQGSAHRQVLTHVPDVPTIV